MDIERFTCLLFKLSHKQVQTITRSYLTVNTGCTVTTKKYKSHHQGTNVKLYDDVFTNKEGVEFICEYKPEQINNEELQRSIGQCLAYTAESKLRCFLVIHLLTYRLHRLVLEIVPRVGLIIYSGTKVILTRQPVDTQLKQGTLIEVKYNA